MPAPSEQRPLERPARAEPGSGKILVVDDQRNMRATTAIVLRSAGHTVDEAEDGAAALQRIQQQTFDVVLTDLRMPIVDGMELLREAQRLGVGELAVEQVQRELQRGQLLVAEGDGREVEVLRA